MSLGSNLSRDLSEVPLGRQQTLLHAPRQTLIVWVDVYGATLQESRPRLLHLHNLRELDRDEGVAAVAVPLSSFLARI